MACVRSQDGSRLFSSIFFRVPVPPTQQDNTHKNSPAIQRQKRAQKLRDIRTHPAEHVANQPQANMDKQYATAINDSLKLDLEEKTALDGPLLQSWDEDKVFDHPMHRLERKGNEIQSAQIPSLQCAHKLSWQHMLARRSAGVRGHLWDRSNEWLGQTASPV